MRCSIFAVILILKISLKVLIIFRADMSSTLPLTNTANCYAIFLDILADFKNATPSLNLNFFWIKKHSY